MELIVQARLLNGLGALAASVALVGAGQGMTDVSSAIGARMALVYWQSMVLVLPAVFGFAGLYLMAPTHKVDSGRLVALKGVASMLAGASALGIAVIVISRLRDYWITRWKVGESELFVSVGSPIIFAVLSVAVFSVALLLYRLASEGLGCALNRVTIGLIGGASAVYLFLPIH